MAFDAENLLEHLSAAFVGLFAALVPIVGARHRERAEAKQKNVEATDTLLGSSRELWKEWERLYRAREDGLKEEIARLQAALERAQNADNIIAKEET